MNLTSFETPNDLLGKDGTKLGPTDYLLINQQRIDLFAEATGDHQWIHVDSERAQRETEFGSTIAHGYLTLSLTNLFLPQLLEIKTISMGINYGLDKLRFPSPVKVNSRIRAYGEILSVDEFKGGVRCIVRVTVEIEGQERPACIADTISLYY